MLYHNNIALMTFSVNIKEVVDLIFVLQPDCDAITWNPRSMNIDFFYVVDHKAFQEDYIWTCFTNFEVDEIARMFL